MRNRLELPQHLVDTGCITKGIEVGSFEGTYSKYILENWTGHLFLVDVWRKLDEEEYIDGSNQIDAKTTIGKVFDNLSGLEDRSTIIRTTSQRASHMFNNNFFDFVYIDANHKFEYVFDDMILWYPKLRPGGIMAGHDFIADYDIRKADENGDTHVWLDNNGKSEYAGMFGVNKAVDDFCKIKNIKYETTTDEYLKTWYFQKDKE